MECLTTKYLRRWLLMPQCFSSVRLYGAATKPQLPLLSLVEKYKVIKVQHLTLRNSKYEKVRGARVNLEAGRKCSRNGAGSRVTPGANRHCGKCSSRETRPGNSKINQMGNSRQRSARKLVQKEVRVMQEDSRHEETRKLGESGSSK